MYTPSNSPVISEKPMFRVIGKKVKGQIDIWYLFKTFVENISWKYYDFCLNSYRKMNISRFFPYKCIRNQIDIAIK